MNLPVTSTQKPKWTGMKIGSDLANPRDLDRSLRDRQTCGLLLDPDISGSPPPCRRRSSARLSGRLVPSTLAARARSAALFSGWRSSDSFESFGEGEFSVMAAASQSPSSPARPLQRIRTHGAPTLRVTATALPQAVPRDPHDRTVP